MALPEVNRLLPGNLNVRIGVAIPAYNRIERTRECLTALRNSTSYAGLFVTLVDDGSCDGTGDIVRGEFPQVTVLSGDGSLWWSGATNLAVVKCLEVGCEYVLLLNQDCAVWPDAIDRLLEHALSHPRTICAAVTVDLEDPDHILWAGTRWQPVCRVPLVFQAKGIKVDGMRVANLPRAPIPCDMTGGRGLLVPRIAFEEVGLLDARALPQYGADNDFTLRARESGYDIHVVPQALVSTRQRDSVVFSGVGNQTFLQRVSALLFSRRNGAAASVCWTLARRHTPRWAFLPTYSGMLAIALKRAWIESRLVAKNRRTMGQVLPGFRRRVH